MPTKAMGKLNLEGFAKKGIPDKTPNDEIALKRKRAEDLKFSSSWKFDMEPLAEASKENLLETDKNGNGVSNDMKHAPHRSSEIRRPRSRRQDTSTDMKPRDSGEPLPERPGRGRQHLDDYPSESGEDYDVDVMSSQIDGEIGQKHNDLDILTRGKNMVQFSMAQRRAWQGRPGTPTSYPGTSDGRVTSTPNSPQENAVQPLQITRQVDAASSTYQDQHKSSHYQDTATTNPLRPNKENGKDEYGARYMFDSAAAYHKHHVRSRSQQPTQSPRKPTPGPAQPAPDRTSSEAVPNGYNVPPHDKAGHILGLPETPPRASFAQTGRANLIHHQHNGQHPADTANGWNDLQPNNTHIDYNEDELHLKTFAELMSESFDDDPRRPREIDLTAASLPKHLERLSRSSDQNQKIAFFSEMTLLEWEQSGKWFNDRFVAVNAEISKKREERRAIAKKFEDKVARRESAVKRERADVEAQLKDMKASGGKVLEIRSPAPKRFR